MVCGTRVLSAGELGDEVGDLNYYERHIGDYIKDTAHLSLLEHGVYTRLLDVYYLREGGIPKDQAYRLVSASSKAEKAAVESILREFFQLKDGYWIQGRCQDVIAEYHVFVEKQKAAGRASGAKRALNHRSTTVEPAFDSGSTKTQPPTPHSPLPNLRAEIPPAGAPVPDPRKALFDLGVSILGEAKRGLIGKAVSQVGESKVAEVIAQMAAKPPVGDPSDYFAKATQKQKREVAC
jgi:uncharacterized protein YdaU (DUF1376 family)